MSSKHHVTIEECQDEDDIRQQRMSQQFSVKDDIDISHVNSNHDMYIEDAQAWEEVDALEEKARNEKMQDQSMAKENASQAARIFTEAQQSSG